MTQSKQSSPIYQPKTVVENRFIISQAIGRGSQAIVYSAVDRQTSKVVALKQHRNTSILDHSAISQIQSESTLLKQLSHPNIVKCYWECKLENEYLQAIEYVDGQTLKQLIASNFPEPQNINDFMDLQYIANQLKPHLSDPNLLFRYQSLMRRHIKDRATFNPNDKTQKPAMENQPTLSKKRSYFQHIEQIFDQLIDVLCYLQSKNVIHRDLKPENIMITSDFQVKLIDFGFVKKSQTASTLLGSNGFMAPEIQVEEDRNKGYNQKVDIWAAGAIFFEALYGFSPFIVTQIYEFIQIQAQFGLYLPPDLYDEVQVDEQFQNLIERICVTDPAKRPDALQLRELFGKYSNIRRVTTSVKHIKVFLVGAFGIGKTTLIHRLAKRPADDHVSVVERQLLIDNEPVRLQFFDTLGTEARASSLIPALTRRVELCILCWKDEDTFEGLLDQVEFIRSQTDKIVMRGVNISRGMDCVKELPFPTIVVREGSDLDGFLEAAVRECLASNAFHVKEAAVEVCGPEGGVAAKGSCC